MKVTLHDENLETKAYFDWILTEMHFVPTILVTLFYITRARKFKMADIDELLNESKASKKVRWTLGALRSRKLG